ncbi:ABC transporter permease [Nostocoides sp. F2B08]|uniref:ABC transporter permease n=1 Tax=Nostocoides sp. F2B08 TaxID=2653936 RepID=UPI001263AB9E|nr:ABC transporter permease [Tetrasphaera sp. F2B08]KAB7744532.1 ABC transporter permease [Tetrasphaera sp. F2B08]
MTRPAPAMTRILASARFESTTLLRNGEQLLVSLLLPAMALVVLALSSYPELGEPRIAVVTPGVLALAVVSTAFTGQAIATAFDRRYGVLRLFGVSPLGRGGLLAGKALAVMTVLVLQTVLLGVVAAGLGWRPGAVALVLLVVTVLIGAACFVSIALLLAGVLRAEAVLALANLLWILFLGLGLLLPVDTLPAAAESVARWLPPGLLGESARTAALEGTAPLTGWVALLGWAAVAGGLARRTFRWSD